MNVEKMKRKLNSDKLKDRKILYINNNNEKNLYVYLVY